MSADYASILEKENFNPDNPFHVALKKHGKYNYDRVIEHATILQIDEIAKGQPISGIA